MMDLCMCFFDSLPLRLVFLQILFVLEPPKNPLLNVSGTQH